MNEESSVISTPASNLSADRRLLELLDQMNRRDAWTRAMLCVFFGILLILGVLLGILVVRQSMPADSRVKETSGWRESLLGLSRQPDEWNDWISVSILRSFLNSKTHHDEAVAASDLLLRRLFSPPAFQQLLYAVYPSPDYADLKEILSIGRDITSRRGALFTQKQQLTDQAKDKKAPAYQPTAQLNNLDSQINVFGDELTSVCNKVGEILRKPRPSTNISVNLSGLYFYSCDLSGNDLSNSNLSGSTFEDADVSGATLKQVSNYDGFDFYDSAWWRAKEISPDFLVYLKDHTYPYYKGDIYPWNKKPQKEEYLSNLDRLCKAASVDCSNKPEKFPK
jgi:hypothetical protein